MKISCPKCGASGNLPDHEIPEDGRFLSCPKCKHGFDVKKPKAASNEYLVDICPACSYSTFGDERFGTCPKCGVFIKTFVDRQREDMARAREQEILNRKFSRDTSPPSSMPMANGSSTSSPEVTRVGESGIAIGEFIENLHPVNLVGYGTALVSVVILLMGILGLFDYFGTDYAAKVSEESIALGIADKPSSFKIFLNHGLVPWVETFYGAALLAVAVFFLRKQAQARLALGWLLWAFIAYVPALMVIRFLTWWLQPIPHTWGGYATNLFNIVFISALVGIPLYLLISFLDDKRIRSVVRL